MYVYVNSTSAERRGINKNKFSTVVPKMAHARAKFWP